MSKDPEGPIMRGVVSEVHAKTFEVHLYEDGVPTGWAELDIGQARGEDVYVGRPSPRLPLARARPHRPRLGTRRERRDLR